MKETQISPILKMYLVIGKCTTDLIPGRVCRHFYLNVSTLGCLFLSI